MRQGQQVRWDPTWVSERSALVDVHSVSHVDDLPPLCTVARWTACDLKSDQYQAHPRQQSVQVWLDSADKAAVVPVHQVTLLDCVNKVH